jgi:hypothetical protein
MASVFTAADLAYLADSFFTLEELSAGRDVSALDELERDFAPDYDRRRFDRPPTRDLLVAAPRERFPEVFERSAVR